MSRPLILIHGYSDTSSSFKRWRTALMEHFKDSPNFSIHLCDYRTLTNEISLKDIAEGFDRALRSHPAFQPTADGTTVSKEFDAIVHSTGMLVIRAWLTAYESSKRHARLKHLIGLAPATFGSPLAKKGRSWLGAVFKGNKEWGPDFMEAGDRVLDALELGSSQVWELAHKDLLSPQPFYGKDADTPYAFTFCGVGEYGAISRMVTEESGADGVVRWAGCALNTRKIQIDLSVSDNPQHNPQERVVSTPWNNIDTLLVPVAATNHSSILREPPSQLVELVVKALKVSDSASYTDWLAAARAHANNVYEDMRKDKKGNIVRPKQHEFQQFIVRVIDERGDPVPDYYIQLYKGEKDTTIRDFAMEVDTYSRDPSYRCFHVNLNELADKKGLWISIIASSGTDLLGYTGHDPSNPNGQIETRRPDKWNAKIPLPDAIPVATQTDEATSDEAGHDKKPTISFFYPLTTTLIEIKLNREPFPFNVAKHNRVATIVDTPAPD